MSVRSRWLQYLLAVVIAVVAVGIQIAIGDEFGYMYVFQALLLSVLLALMFREASSRREAERRMKGHEERLHAALEAGRMGTWEWDLSTNRVTWSAELECMHGLEPGAFPGTIEGFQNDIHPEDRDRVQARIQQAVETGQDYRVEYRIVIPDGTTRWVEARGKLTRDAAGMPLRMNGVCMDISQRKRDEEDLQFLAEASRSFSSILDYEKILNKIAELAVPHFADGCVVFVTEPSGVPRQIAVAHVDPAKAVIVQEYARRYPPDMNAAGGTGRVVRTGQSQLVEEITEAMLKATIRDAEQLRILSALEVKSYIGVPLKLPGHVFGALSFIASESGRRFSPRDLAVAEDLARRAAKAIENVRLYARLREEHRRKDEFLAMLAHELRNPLAPIRSGLELLALSGIEHETIPLMREQTTHLVRLVDDLLDVSRIMQGKIRLVQKAVEMRELVEHTVAASQALVVERGQHVQLSLPEQPVWVRGDRVRIAQCLTNLLRNAVKYTEEGGRIWVTLGVEGDQIELAVQDDGIGIEPDLLPHIFDLFIQADRSLERSKGGMGIGLTLVRSLVEAHGGTITVRSDGLGQGSEFVMRLPVGQPEAERDAPGSSAEAVPPRRVLVVDDNTAAARILGLLLTTAGGHEIEYAYDGPSALEAAHKLQPEIILLDIGLPGMNGYDVVRELRTSGKFGDALIVALTGYGTEEDRLRSLEAGFDEHLVKPPSLDMLVELFSHPKLERVANER
ncbi:MAG: ATP-binding protein [Pirellulales bacterium]